MLKKQFVAEFKAVSPEEGGQPGQFSAVVAVYNNVDSAGDRIKSGAFDKTLEAWKKSGDPIPIVMAHGWNDPWMHIGYADPNDVESIPGRGLHVKAGVLDIDDNPLAKQVYRLMQRRTLKEFSFGYRVPQGGEKKAQDGAWDLMELDLIEFGPCLKGVNSETELLAIKSEMEAERRRGKGQEPTLEERLTALESMVAALKAEAPVLDPEVETPVKDPEDPIEDPAADPADPVDPVTPVPDADPDPVEPETDPEGSMPDIDLMLREQAIEALEVECRDVLSADHSLDDIERHLDAVDNLLKD